MPAFAETTAGPARSVLLVEEYDALAAAITSALKKFAPDHRTHTVASLIAADASVKQVQPQLFVIDFDPPHPGAIAFLNRMSDSYPDARVLVIASGISPEFISERFGPNGIQFVEKPFELAEFGAAIQALLGPWTRKPSGDSRGALRDLNLKDLIPLECLGGATAILRVTTEAGQSGEIHFVQGQICQAKAATLEGTTALVEMIRWEKAASTEYEGLTTGPRTIHGSWQAIFLEALRQAKPAEKIALAPSPAEPKEPRPKSGKKVVVIDDTEMLSIFVEDTLSIADPELQIATAPTGTEGIARVETLKPDLVLLDYSLPDLPGDQVCERLSKNETTARIPIIMMSGHIPEMMATAQRYPNVVATIAKPFMSGALVELVKKTLALGALQIAKKAPPVISRVIKVPTPAGTGRSIPIQQKQIKATVHIAPTKPKQEVKAGPIVQPAIATAPISLAPSSSIEMIEPPPAPIVHRPSPADRPVVRPQIVPPRPPAKLASPKEILFLKLGLEVISVQVSPRFQIATIRAKHSPATLSLARGSDRRRDPDDWGTGFQLGTIDLDSNGRITRVRVLPMHRPPGSIRAHNGFDINDVRLLNEAAVIQLTSGVSAPMTMQMVAAVTIVRVELSDRFEVARLILQLESSRVRATLSPEQQGENGVEFETIRARLDSSAHLAELFLRPIAG